MTPIADPFSIRRSTPRKADVLGGPVLPAGRARRFAVVLCFLFVAVLPAVSPGAEWVGFRGLSNQGVSDSVVAPTSWTDTENVRWKVDVDGEGYSSPIVLDEGVVFSTAMPTEPTLWQTDPLNLIAMGLASVMAAIIVLRTVTSGHPRSSAQVFSAGVFVLLVTLLPHGVRAVVALEDDHSSVYRGWLHSGGVFALSFILSASLLPQKSNWRILWGVVGLGFAVAVVLARPRPDYYYLAPGSWIGEPTYRTFFVMAIVSLVAVATALLGKRDLKADGDLEESNPARWVTFPLVIAIAIMTPILAYVAWPLRPQGLSQTQRFWGAVGCSAVTLLVTCYLLGRSRIYVKAASAFSMAKSTRFWFLMGTGMLLIVGINVAFLLRPTLGGGVSLRVMSAGALGWLLLTLVLPTREGLRLPTLLAVPLLAIGSLSFFDAKYFRPKKTTTRALFCLDRSTGETKWKRELFRGPKSTVSAYNSAASPTPVLDRDRIHCWFGSAGLVCVDRQGKVLWENTNVPFEGIHGVASSLVMAGDLLIVESSMSQSPYLTAINRETGKRVWTSDLPPWPGPHGRHRTPTIMSDGDRQIVLLWGCGAFWEGANFPLTAFDARTGEQLWEYEVDASFGGEDTASIIWADDLLYLPNQKFIRAISLTKLSEGLDPLVWETNLKSKGPNVCSPVLCEGLIFSVSDAGIATCVDGDTGEIHWTKRLRGNHSASPFAVGDNVYFSSESGRTVIVKARTEYEEVSRNDLGEGIYASIAPVDESLFIRTVNSLCCVANESQ